MNLKPLQWMQHHWWSARIIPAGNWLAGAPWILILKRASRDLLWWVWDFYDIATHDSPLEGPAQHVPAITTETIEWCAPAVCRLAWCKTFVGHHVDPSKPARFFIVSSFSMLRANSVCKFLLWARNSCCEQILALSKFDFVSSFSLLWANFLCFEQFVNW